MRKRERPEGSGAFNVANETADAAIAAEYSPAFLRIGTVG